MTELPSRRGAERSAVALRCEIKIGSELWHYSDVKDLSPSGFLLEWPAGVGDLSTIRIRLAGLEALTARVCWRDGRHAGCQFVAPLSPYVFEHILRTYP